jgi:hypothetical protein
MFEESDFIPNLRLGFVPAIVARPSLFRLLSDFMSECPDSVTASDAYRDVTPAMPKTNPWNPNASTTTVPKDFVIRMDSV